MPANTCPNSWQIPDGTPDGARTVWCALGKGHNGGCVDSNGNPRP